MWPIVVMDKTHNSLAGPSFQGLEYRQPGDRRTFWTGKYPTAGPVHAFLCSECGRIALYGEVSDG